MAYVQLGTKAAGTVVKAKINGTLRNFLVVHNGRPSTSYDTSYNNGVILLMQDIYDNQPWNNSSSYVYASSTIHSYLNNPFYNLIDASIRAQVMAVNVPYSSSTVSAKVFLLSGREVGAGAASYMWTEGSTLAYFSGIESTAANAKRVAYLSGAAASWWTRSMVTSGGAWSVGGNGITSGTSAVTGARGVRPAFVLPSTLLVADDGTLVANTAPTVPPGITVPATINGGSTITVSWTASTDAQGNLSGYKLERQLNGGSWSQIFQANALSTTDTVSFGTATVAYRVRAYDAMGLESAYQTSPTRTVVNNTAPTTPGGITVPATVAGGGSLVVTWGASTDAQGNLAGYKLERSTDGGTSYTQIYQGANLSYTDAIVKGWPTVTYRVRAYDSLNAESGYATSATRTVDNTVAPVIASDTSGDMGTLAAGFTWRYTVDQADGEATAVVEKIDGARLRGYTAALGEENLFSVTGETFLTLLNGSHTMTVTATGSGGKDASYTVTFAKGVHSLSITLNTPLPADAPITKMVMSLAQSIPADADYEVLVTNNALDDSPVWEDATGAVKNARNHVFENTVAEQGNALNFKITATRGPSNLGGFISTIGGAFA